VPKICLEYTRTVKLGPPLRLRYMSSIPSSAHSSISTRIIASQAVQEQAQRHEYE
jgi:hypothetical protein